jgi:hypothetical protein
MSSPATSGGFVGLRPYEVSEAPVFAGRDYEASEIAALILAHREVLLYGSSGVGKSSLVNAGVLPRLKSLGFDFVHRIHFGSPDSQQPFGEAAGNRYWNATLAAISNDLPDEPGAHGNDIDSSFSRGWLRSARLLVFEQAEELLIGVAEDEIVDFLRMLGELSRVPRTRLLFVLRTEFLPRLERLSVRFPEELATRYELRPLARDEAVEAAMAGFRMGGVVIERSALETLVDQAAASSGGSTAEVEPILFQLTCSQIFQRARQSGRATVDTSDLGALIASPLIALYDDAIHRCVDAVTEGQIRNWLESNFITSAGTRAFVFRGSEETAGMPNCAVDHLLNAHLIHGEYRGGRMGLELISDALIEPIRRSNRAFAERNR